MVVTVVSKRQCYTIAHVDVYSGRAFVWAEVVCLLLRLLKKRYLVTLHGGNLPLFSVRWPTRIRWLLRSANAVTVPSRYFFEAFKAIRKDLRLIPNPVKLDDFSFKCRDGVQPKIIWLRNFHNVYNPVLAPRMISLLLKEHPDICLSMIGADRGDGSLESTIKTAKNLGVLAHVTFPGAVTKDAVPGYLQEADIFVNTTNVDNTPVSVLEAMASGLCIVSTNVGGLPFLLDHGRDALLVPPNDPASMAAALRQLLAEPRLAKELSLNARKKVESFDWSKVLPKWSSLFDEIAEG